MRFGVCYFELVESYTVCDTTSIYIVVLEVDRLKCQWYVFIERYVF
jgi:hypothetical protein